MSMHDGRYYLSNSEMNDWEAMCPRVWKAKYIDRLPELWQESPDVTVMDWGVLFETLAIGSGVDGKTVPEEKVAKMKKSDYYARIAKQAEDCRRYFKALGGKILSRQEYIFTSFFDADGQLIYVCGGLDINYQFFDQRPNMIIDLKLTGDNDNDFGKYQFGNPDKINPQQAVHYKMLHLFKYGEEASFQYWIFDKSPSMKQNRIGVDLSEVGLLLHQDKCSRIYNEITTAMALDDWDYRNTFDNCRNCVVKCDMERVLPDLVEITA